MKNSHICPKCNARNIIRIPGTVGSQGVGNKILTGWTISQAVKVARYVCGVCGYNEEWIDDADDLRKLKEKFG